MFQVAGLRTSDVVRYRAQRVAHFVTDARRDVIVHPCSQMLISVADLLDKNVLGHTHT